MLSGFTGISPFCRAYPVINIFEAIESPNIAVEIFMALIKFVSLEDFSII